MESVYVPGTRQERVGIEKPAIDLYDLSKKIQYHVTRKEFEIANDLLKDLPSDRSQEMKKMFEPHCKLEYTHNTVQHNSQTV